MRKIYILSDGTGRTASYALEATIIPIRLFINEKGYAKLEIALAKGKHSYDKRESIKQKDQKRDMERFENY